jgi:dUTP pyrophosphatase
MKLQVTRIDRELPLPRYETPGACAFDVTARVDMTIEPKTLALIPGNLIVHVPNGHVLMLCSRSSTPKKKGLMTPHGFGVIDRDYCGPNDEIKVQVYNFTDSPVAIKRGDRVAQAMVVPAPLMDIEETETGGESRGGFGSTG